METATLALADLLKLPVVYSGGHHSVVCDGHEHHQINDDGSTWLHKHKCTDQDWGPCRYRAATTPPTTGDMAKGPYQVARRHLGPIWTIMSSGEPTALELESPLFADKVAAALNAAYAAGRSAASADLVEALRVAQAGFTFTLLDRADVFNYAEGLRTIEAALAAHAKRQAG